MNNLKEVKPLFLFIQFRFKINVKSDEIRKSNGKK